MFHITIHTTDKWIRTFVLWRSEMSPIWVNCVNLTGFCQDALNLHIVVSHGGRKKLQKMAKSAKNSQKWRTRPTSRNHIPEKKFFGLRCLVISVGNKFRSKIYSNQVNRLAASNCPKEITFFPHLGPVIPRFKFGSFFQNSHRSNDLTNS